VRDFAAMPRSFVPEERMLDRQRAKAVRRMLRQRRMREQYFPADLFADPAWDMLLDLCAARLERQPVSVSSLCIAAAVPPTTALRWITTMHDAGLFGREADPSDKRRAHITLTQRAADGMRGYFAMAAKSGRVCTCAAGAAALTWGISESPTLVPTTASASRAT
jgi:hypothetical protein